jgi:hypothetical protein
MIRKPTKLIIIASLMISGSLAYAKVQSTVVANQSNPLTPEEKSMLMYKDFLSSSLSSNIMEEIRKEYNITQGGFEHKYERNAISYGFHQEHGGFVAVVYVRPVDVEHVDRLTFLVKPNLIQYGKGVKLLKYERAVD